MSFCILVGINCRNIPNCTPQNGNHGVTKVTKKDDIQVSLGADSTWFVERSGTSAFAVCVVFSRHFFGSNCKRKKRLIIFCPPPKGEKYQFLDVAPPPPIPLRPVHKTGIQAGWAGGLRGGPNQKFIRGHVSWTK